jgi:hypothetical protein
MAEARIAFRTAADGGTAEDPSKRRSLVLRRDRNTGEEFSGGNG